LHSGKRSIADKDEAGGSSPPRPTTSNKQEERLSRVRLEPVRQASSG
jgi:hypothetical protein